MNVKVFEGATRSSVYMLLVALTMDDADLFARAFDDLARYAVDKVSLDVFDSDEILVRCHFFPVF